MISLLPRSLKMPMFRKKPVVIEARQYANDDTSYDTLHWVNDGQLK